MPRVTWRGFRRFTVSVLVIGWSLLFAFVAEAGVGDGLIAPRRTVSVVDTATDRAAVKPIKVGPYASSIAISADGEKAYVVTSGNRSVTVAEGRIRRNPRTRVARPV